MTPRLVRSSLAAAAVAITMLAACGDDSGSGDSPDSTAPAATTGAAATTVPAITVPSVLDPLDGTSWVLNTAALGVEGGDSVVSTVTFASGTTSGTTGCNGFNASYAVDGDTIDLGPAITTKIACEDPAGAVETAVLAALDNVTKFSVNTEALTLTDDAGTALLTYSPAPDTVEGNWIATGYLNADASGFVSIVLDTEVTASFQQDGTVAGSAGCNTYTGPYMQPISGTVTVGPLATTRKLCSEPAEIMEQENAYLAALQSATTFTNDGAVLTLFNAEGQRVVTYNTFSAG